MKKISSLATVTWVTGMILGVSASAHAAAGLVITCEANVTSTYLDEHGKIRFNGWEYYVPVTTGTPQLGDRITLEDVKRLAYKGDDLQTADGKPVFMANALLDGKAATDRSYAFRNSKNPADELAAGNFIIVNLKRGTKHEPNIFISVTLERNSQVLATAWSYASEKKFISSKGNVVLSIHADSIEYAALKASTGSDDPYEMLGPDKVMSLSVHCSRN